MPNYAFQHVSCSVCLVNPFVPGFVLLHRSMKHVNKFHACRFHHVHHFINLSIEITVSDKCHNSDNKSGGRSYHLNIDTTSNCSKRNVRCNGDCEECLNHPCNGSQKTE